MSQTCSKFEIACSLWKVSHIGNIHRSLPISQQHVPSKECLLIYTRAVLVILDLMSVFNSLCQCIKLPNPSLYPVVVKPCLHRIRGCSYGLVSSTTWAKLRLLEWVGHWWRSYDGWPSFHYSCGIDQLFLAAFQTTASDSALTAVVAARSLYTRRHPETKLEDLVIYTTTQTHSLGAKAGLVLGLSTRALEVTPEDNFSLRGNTLERALKEDAKTGKKPFILSEFSGIKWTVRLSHSTFSCYCRNYIIWGYRQPSRNWSCWSVDN